MVWSGDFKSAMKAYEKGDYTYAVKELKLLAKIGKDFSPADNARVSKDLGENSEGGSRGFPIHSATVSIFKTLPENDLSNLPVNYKNLD